MSSPKIPESNWIPLSTIPRNPTVEFISEVRAVAPCQFMLGQKKTAVAAQRIRKGKWRVIWRWSFAPRIPFKAQPRPRRPFVDHYFQWWFTSHVAPTEVQWWSAGIDSRVILSATDEAATVLYWLPLDSDDAGFGERPPNAYGREVEVPPSFIAESRRDAKRCRLELEAARKLWVPQPWAGGIWWSLEDHLQGVKDIAATAEWNARISRFH